MSWSIDDILEGMTGDHVRVMNKDTPEVHKHKKTEIKPSVQREEEDEQMIRHRLQVTIEGMKCVGGEGSWNEPLVMWLVDILVDQWMVQGAMYPINAVVSEDQEKWY